ncbi:hypothetical protein CU097_007727 [Rhizopus azygosporus]|uniref:Uncharacterized protein n=1 Tax=Rhizopus azygosporus TaxID=86630 RepID=A0A367JMT5_RHIAZ|nr:hypothetical protein CU097_007727 [Rhizopus azygosporus]
MLRSNNVLFAIPSWKEGFAPLRQSTYLRKHLTVAEKCRLDEKVEEDPHVKPSKAVVEASSRTWEAVPSICNSSSALWSTHKARTSNAVESYHSALYTVIVKEQPLVSSLRCLLQYAKKDSQSLNAFFTDGFQPYCGQNKRQRKQRKIVDFYKMSDSRAHNNNKAIFDKQKTIAAAEHADKTTTASKKRKLPEVADTDDEKDDFKFETHNFLKQLIEEQLSVEGVPGFSMNDMNTIEYLFFQLKETDLLREFAAEDKLKKFIKKCFTNPSNERKRKQKDYSELLEELPEGIRDLLIKDTDHEANEANEAVNKKCDEGSDSEMAIDLTERTPE